MDVGNLTQLISSVGFPIVMCIALLWYIIKINDARKEETKEFTDALNRNTIMLQKLCDKMDLKCSVRGDEE